MKRGGQPGNTNGAKDQRLWTDMLKRKCAQDPNRLERIALKVLDAAEEGQPWAVQELSNRLDGKPVQPVETKDTTERPSLTNAYLEHVARGGDPEKFSESTH